MNSDPPSLPSTNLLKEDINPPPDSVSTLHPTNVAKLTNEKISLRIKNEHYLRKHPEISKIISYFMRNLLLTQPEDSQEFAVDLLSDDDLRSKIKTFEKLEIDEEQFFNKIE